MKIREITETPYLQKTLNTLGNAQRTGAPIPPNKLPKGPIKNISTKAPISQANRQADQNLIKPGKTVPMPTASNKETDYEVDRVQGDQVTMKTKTPTPQAPQSITVNKKDLDPVITNLQRRQKATQ